MIIVSVTGPTMKHALAQVGASRRFADAFEFRLDLIRNPLPRQLFLSARKPVVATCRPKWEGGMFSGSEQKRAELLRRACADGADWVDVELDAGVEFRKSVLAGLTSKLILSHHHFGSGVFDVKRVYNRLHAAGADVMKFAYVTDDAADLRHAFAFFSLARRHRQKAIVIAMGERGEASRILYKKFGGWATYAATEDGEGTLHGQIPASRLRRIYRADKLTRTTKIFGVVGNPVRQSKGVFLHNPLFHRAKVNAVYCKFEVIALNRFMQFIAPVLNGFSVTIPYKEAIIKFLTGLDATARGCGAVNTVIRRGKRFVGSNTDAAGALDAIEKKGKVNGRRMLIVGAGGAARAIAFEAKRRGAAVYLVNRTEVKARRLARQLGVNCIPIEGIGGLTFDVIANATSVGMTPLVNQSPLPRSLLKRSLVFDVVFNPPMTKLLRDAQSAGAVIVPGTEMYINQAARQSALYTGILPSRATLRAIMNKL